MILRPRAKPMAMAELESLIENCISKKGVHLIDLAIRGEGKGTSVEVYVDSEQSITTEICTEVSREVERLIETSGVVRGPYRLTVSSPGIARPFKYSWQYKKHIGREVDVNVRSDEGLRGIVGKLESVDEKTILLSVGKDGQRESIALVAIVEARVRAPW